MSQLNEPLEVNVHQIGIDLAKPHAWKKNKILVVYDLAGLFEGDLWENVKVTVETLALFERLFRTGSGGAEIRKTWRGSFEQRRA